MSLSSIPVSEITNYHSEFEMLDSKRCFLDIIQAMDSVYLDYVNEKSKSS